MYTTATKQMSITKELKLNNTTEIPRIHGIPQKNVTRKLMVLHRPQKQKR